MNNYYTYALKDIPKTQEHSLKISEALFGVPKEKVKCSHCTKIGGIGIMKRWHFDNCKELVI